MKIRMMCFSAVLLATLLAPASAQTLRDPTRPPMGAGQPAPGPSGAVSAGAPQLQSILAGRARGGRHLAVIDGQTVRVGDSVDGARVTRIGATEVELVRGGQRQVLRLYPQAEADAARAPRATMTDRD